MKTQAPINKPTNSNGHSPFFQKGNDGHFFGDNSSPFFRSSSIQAKLTVNQPNDPYEKEADAMADKVVQRLAQTSNATENGSGGFIQAKFTPYSNTDTSSVVQSKCAECEKEEKLQEKELGEKPKKELQKKAIFESNAEDDEKNIQRKCATCEAEEKIQKKPDTASSATVSSGMEPTLNSTKGLGSPLPADSRQEMESNFGADFSGVRIHSDSQSSELNKNLHAQAFTYGSDVYFNSGKYNPDNKEGKHLLAHELTHVIQQSGSSEPGPARKAESQTLARKTNGKKI